MRKAYLELHVAVFLFGFTAILGKLISISAISLVWWRVLIASVGMLVIVRLGRTLRELPVKRILQYTGIGVIVALHWITFFGSIKASNASVALVTMATASFFTSLIEPLVLRRRAFGFDVLLGIVIVPAMILIVHGIDRGMHMGIWLGLVSAVLVALFSSLNKLLIGHARPLQIAFFELSGAWVFISVVFGFALFLGVPETLAADLELQVPQTSDWLYLLVLALLCTTLAYVLAVRALHHLSAFATGLVINLEPVYGIFLAWILLKENRELTPGFYIGVVIIIIVVFTYPFIRKKDSTPNKTKHGTDQSSLSSGQ